MNFHTAAPTLARAFQRWPGLLLAQAIQSKLEPLSRQLSAVLHNVDEHSHDDEKAEKENAELQGMYATLEAELLHQIAGHGDDGGKRDTKKKCP